MEGDKETGEGVYTTHYRINDTRLGRWFSVDPKAHSYSWITPYASMNDNPIRYTDPFGDEVNIDEAFRNNSAAMGALKILLQTKEGKEFIGMYAKAGQEVAGFTFNNDGKYHTRKIDLKFTSTPPSRPTVGGTTNAIESNGRLAITVDMTPDLYNWSLDAMNDHIPLPEGPPGTTTVVSKSLNDSRSLFGSVVALTHELFMHTYIYSIDWLDNGKLDQNSTSHHLIGHAAAYFYYKEGQSSPGTWWMSGAASVFNQTNRALGLNYTQGQIYNLIYNQIGGRELTFGKFPGDTKYVLGADTWSQYYSKEELNRFIQYYQK